MRLDHIAYRVKDRYKTAKFFEEAFNYSVEKEFQIEFEDGTTADCLALTPVENRSMSTDFWTLHHALKPMSRNNNTMEHCVYHAPPEIFVSDGPDGSIVGDWVSERGNIGGIHHIAYQVADINVAMNDWKEKGYVEFLSTLPMECPGLKQIFTKPSELTGVIYELIERTGDGFCEDNVKDLMNSTKDLS